MEDLPLDLSSQSLLGYLPAMVIKKIVDDNKDLYENLPCHYLIKTVSLFADISGFTKLSESFAKLGRIGPEFLAFSLNRYMEQLINIIGKNGGDIFKFAGDALLVIWPEGISLEDSCKRAVQCSLEIQNKLHNVGISEDKKLSVKIGLGVGEVRILFVGGQFNRAEYLIVGEAMRVACLSETCAVGGETICHESVHNLVSGFYEYEKVVQGEDDHGYGTKDMNFYKIKALRRGGIQVRADAYLMRTKFNANKVRMKLKLLRSFVPKAITLYLDLEKERWSKEIRMLTIMFLNLKVDLSQTVNDEGIIRIQKIVKTVQRCIYMTKGALNKFLMDDKGSVMLIAWGLPPFSEIDDAHRAVFTAFELTKELKQYDCGAYMGITTGSCFAGVCGTIGGRREYSLLGEVVNLSARHMQQSIELGKANKSKYEIIICSKTKNAIQNSIASEWVCEGYCKGFKDLFQFYRPLHPDSPKLKQPHIILPSVRTYLNNYPLDLNNEKKDNSIQNPLLPTFVVARKFVVESLKKDILSAFKYHKKECILIRGTHGNGKSLMIRKAFSDIINANKEIKTSILAQKNLENPEFIFVTNHTPKDSTTPFCGFNKTFREIYKFFRDQKMTKRAVMHKLGDEKIEILCDPIGEMLFEANCYSYRKYIEEILDIKFEEHIEVNSQNEKFYQIYPTIQINGIDSYFESRDFKHFGKTIIKFFSTLLIRYKKYLNHLPLILIIEDCDYLDLISIEFIKLIILDERIDSLVLLCSLKDSLYNVKKRANDFLIILDLFPSEQVYIMDNLTDTEDVTSLITQNFEELRGKTINEDLIEIILKKSFRGNILAILDITESMLKNGLITFVSNEALPSYDLKKMDESGDYSTFPIPSRIEKFIGHIMDNYFDIKEIITLKLAAVIGNIFSLSTLHAINEFNSLSFDDIKNILYSFEEKEILDVLYDLRVTHSVFKFTIPFCREVLYQRMLIEQKNDIHLSIARNMQKNKFSYMPQEKEYNHLQHHLRVSERSLIDYINEQDNKETMNFNNLKLCVVKRLQHRIKQIETHLDTTKAGIQAVYSGYIYKKSDSNITWERRYLVISQTKLFYWYEEKEHLTNKVPLASIETKHIFLIETKPDFFVGNNKNILTIEVAEWYKKDILQGARSFFFSCDTREEMHIWVIALNFLKMKSVYDEFSANFSVVSLPLFSIEKEEERLYRNIKKRFKRNLANGIKKSNDFGVSMMYNSIIRRSLSANKASMIDSKSQSMMIRRISQSPYFKGVIEDQENFEGRYNLKKLFDNLSFLSFVNFLAYVQDIIFNLDNIGQLDYINVPSHIEEFKYLPTEDNDPYIQNAIKKLKKSPNFAHENPNNGKISEIKEETGEPSESSKSKSEKEKRDSQLKTSAKLSKSDKKIEEEQVFLENSQNNFQQDTGKYDGISISKSIYDPGFGIKSGLEDLEKILNMTTKTEKITKDKSNNQIKTQLFQGFQN